MDYQLFENNPRISPFKNGDRVFCQGFKKYGKIVAIRDDKYERTEREKNPNHPFYYHVQFDDNSFDTYIAGHYLVKVYEA